ncbi:hypothetical protein [Actinoplanes sp. HUAS TT8]|uniref:hypothetical protein n=1 Tax=Actinoplanes sp. HUAS TT8 TaxID=3447453 RepID=UPI003F51CE6B
MIVARVAALPDVRPRRIRPLLLPMWQVEVVATVRDGQPYDVLDRFLARALAGTPLRGPERLAAYFGLPVALVRRILAGLAAIGHVGPDGALTELGRRSVEDGRRYRDRPGRRMTLWFDGLVLAPVPRTHGTGSIWLAGPELTLGDGTRFAAVPGPGVLPVTAVGDLLERADVADFAGPARPVRAEIAALRAVWLPVYLVECDEEPVLFARAVDGPDPYLSKLLAKIRL